MASANFQMPQTALDWLQLQNQDASTLSGSAGFRFGAWIALQLLMRRPELEGFLAVSRRLLICMISISFLPLPVFSGLILQGDQDSIVPVEDVTKLATNCFPARKNSNLDFRVVHGADHFFRNHMGELVTNLDDYVSSHLKKKPAAAAGLSRDRRRRQLPVA